MNHPNLKPTAELRELSDSELDLVAGGETIASGTPTIGSVTPGYELDAPRSVRVDRVYRK